MCSYGVINIYEHCKVKIASTQNPTSFIHGEMIKCTEDTAIILCSRSQALVIESEVHLIIFDPVQGELVYSAKVESLAHSHVTLSQLEPVKVIQKRQEVRLSIELPIEIATISVGSKIMDLEKCVPMKTINISASGILLSSALDLPQQVQPHILLFLDQDIVLAIARIVRRDIQGSTHFYGCEFINLPENEKEKIRQFIFDHQLKQHRQIRSPKK